MNILIIFAIIIIGRNSDVTADVIECNFNTNRDYLCEIKQIIRNEASTEFTGNHMDGKSDEDVKIIYLNGWHLSERQLKFDSSFCQKFKNIERIHLRNIAFDNIEENSLDECRNLTHFHIPYVYMKNMPEFFFAKQPKITRIDIGIYDLETLSDNFFMNQKELEYLSLVEIGSLPPNIFKSLTKLKHLILSSNKIEALNPEWFENLMNLVRLELYLNIVIELPRNIFKNNGKLKRLEIKSTHIATSHADEFTNLLNLEELHLNGIKFTELPVLRNNGKLKELHLSENKIEKLHADDFTNLRNLKKLDIGHNYISELPKNVFKPLINLEELDCSYNHLTTLNADSFGHHKKLIKLNLERNEITSIDETIIDNTAVLKISMYGNGCSSENIEASNKNEIKEKLPNCFQNYQPQIKSGCELLSVDHEIERASNHLTINWTTNEHELCQSEDIKIVLTDSTCLGKCENKECQELCKDTAEVKASDATFSFLKPLSSCSTYFYTIEFVRSPSTGIEFSSEDLEIDGLLQNDSDKK